MRRCAAILTLTANVPVAEGYLDQRLGGATVGTVEPGTGDLRLLQRGVLERRE